MFFPSSPFRVFQLNVVSKVTQVLKTENFTRIYNDEDGVLGNRMPNENRNQGAEYLVPQSVMYFHVNIISACQQVKNVPENLID